MDPQAYGAEIRAAKKWADDLDMYVVINLHTAGSNHILPLKKAKMFWDYYAPKYKDDAAVIFELVNEPDLKDDNLVRKMNSLYRTTRALAPDTHMILYSFYGMSVKNAQEKINDPDFKEFENTSISFHSYNKFDTRWDGGLTFKAAGFPLINTEMQATNTTVKPRRLDFDNLGENLVRAQVNGVSWIAWQPNLSLGIQDYEFVEEASSPMEYGNALCAFRSELFRESRVTLWFPANCSNV